MVAAGAVPRAVLMLGGGVVADRFGPRRVAVLSDGVRCVVILLAAAALALAPAHLWLLALVALVFGVVDAVFMPAVGALPPRITTADQLARVQGMRGLSIRLSNAVGPLVAGAVLVAGGAEGAFAVAGVLFAVSLATLLTVRVTPVAGPPQRDSARGELRDGLRYVRRHRLLAPLVVVIGLSEMCFSGPVATGLVLLADERGWGAVGMGWVASAFSVGLGQAPSLTVAVAFGALIGLTSGFATTLTGALVQTATDPRYLGRVTSVTTLCTLGLAPVLFPAVGITVELWGAATFFAGCGAICLLAAALGLAVPALRRAELPELGSA